jgi:hypothetical protein
MMQSGRRPASGAAARACAATLALAILALPGQPADAQAERDLLDFRYDWPAEATAVPVLRAELQRRRAAAHAEALANARNSRDGAHDAHLPFHTEMHHQSWSVEARNARYLALTAEIRTDQNGAHPNRDFDALIWDRVRGRARSAASILGRRAIARLRPVYCSRLSAAIAAHGGVPPERCPPLAERPLSFLDRDHDGRFDTLHVLIAPYVAASYADGSFVVDVPFGRGDLAGMAAVDRVGFEEGR